MQPDKAGAQPEKRFYTEQDVIAKYGRGLPTYRKIRRQTGYRRTFDKTDRAEMAAVRSWLSGDTGFRRLVDVYACYCRILADRGYGSSADRDLVLMDHTALVDRLVLNFAKCETEYVWHDLLSSARAIMRGDDGDGYWPFLDKEYLDIPHMKVGKAIINLDEVWAVVYGVLKEFTDTCAEREACVKNSFCLRCDRCNAPIYDGKDARFDPYENLLHCKTCAKGCTHWKGLRK